MKTRKIRWATQPADAKRIEQMPGISDQVANEIPPIGSTITNPYLVDPSTKQPIPLLVADAYIHGQTGDVVVVVTRPH